MEKKTPDLFYKEMEIIKKRIMLNKLIQLNLSLHNAILNYARNNDIPLSFDPTILSLAEEIKKIDIETYPTPAPFKISDDSYHETRNRRRVNRTEKSYSLNIKTLMNTVKWRMNLDGFRRIFPDFTIYPYGISVYCSNLNLPIRVLWQGRRTSKPISPF